MRVPSLVSRLHLTESGKQLLMEFGEVLNCWGFGRRCILRGVNLNGLGMCRPSKGGTSMSRRIPGSERTREGLRDLIEGHLSSEAGRSELVRLATRLIIEEGLEAEVRDRLGRDYYEHGGEAGQGHRNGVREGRLKTAEGFCQRRSKVSPPGRSKTSPLDVMPCAVLGVVPVVHRRDPRCFE